MNMINDKNMRKKFHVEIRLLRSYKNTFVKNDKKVASFLSITINS